MAEKAAEFYKISGIKVTVEQIAYSEMKNKLLLDISSSGGAYDMIATTEYWLSEFNEGGWLTAVSYTHLDVYKRQGERLSVAFLPVQDAVLQNLSVPWLVQQLENFSLRHIVAQFHSPHASQCSSRHTTLPTHRHLSFSSAPNEDSHRQSLCNSSHDQTETPA